MSAIRERQGGAALPLTTVWLACLLLALALAVVAARAFSLRYELWQAASAAALAAARQVEERSLWRGQPELDLPAARTAALSVLRDNGVGGTVSAFSLTVNQRRVLHARKAAPEAVLRVCRRTELPLSSLAGLMQSQQMCVETRAAILRPKRLLPPEEEPLPDLSKAR